MLVTWEYKQVRANCKIVMMVLLRIENDTNYSYLVVEASIYAQQLAQGMRPAKFRSRQTKTVYKRQQQLGVSQNHPDAIVPLRILMCDTFESPKPC